MCPRRRRRRGLVQHGLLQQRARGAARHQPAAGRQHHPDGRRHHASSCPRCARSCQRRRARRGQRPVAGIRATLHDAERTLLIAVSLVILVVLAVPCQLPGAAIPVAAVPVALVGSFAVMYLWGFSLNNLSLMALIVATGLVVDDAIVVLENISRHVEVGQPPFEAAFDRRARGRGDAALDEPRPRRGVRLDPLHGRHRRAAVPRVLDHAGRRHRDLALRLAHPDADAVRAVARPPRRPAAERVAAGERPRLRLAAPRLRPHRSCGRSGTRRSSSACCSASWR